MSAIVTGGSRGIGRAIALRLARDGFVVAVNYVGNTAKAEEVVKHIKDKGGSAIAIKGDVSNANDVKQLFEQTEKAFGTIDVVVNSAGIFKMLPITTATEKDFDSIFSVNVRGTFNVLQEAAKRLSAGARIVTFSSSVVGMTFPAYGPYAASKAAVETLTKTLAQELRGKQITVNAVAPGATATELFFEGKSQEQIDRLSKIAPLERLGTPEEIANVVAFLVGPDGGWINGQVIRVNGGYI